MKQFAKKHKKGLIILIILLVIGGGVGYCGVQTSKTVKALAEAYGADEFANVEYRELREAIYASGTVAGKETKQIVLSASGMEVLDVQVELGSQVKEGDLLVQFDSSELEKTLTATKDRAEITEKTQTVNTNASQRDYSNMKTEQNIATDRLNAKVDQASKDLDAAKKEVDRLGNIYLSAKANRESYEKALAEKQTAAQTLAEQLAALGDTPENAQQAAALNEQLAAVQNEIETWAANVAQATVEENGVYQTYINYANINLKAAQETYDQLVQTRDDTVRSNANSLAGIQDKLTLEKLQNGQEDYATEQQITTYEKQIADCQVKAPFSGIITNVFMKKGDSYVAGSPVLEIVDNQHLVITSYVDEYDISKISLGQKVLFKTKATGDELLEGKITAISPKSATATSTGMAQYAITVDILTGTEKLRLDMNAKLNIILNESEHALTVPYEAIQYDENDQKYVEITGEVGPDGTKARTKIFVTTGMETDYYVEVMSDELKEGMEVVIPRRNLDEDELLKQLQEEGLLYGM